MKKHSDDKAKRILSIYTRFLQGKMVYKEALTEMYGVSQRTIQRDISDIKCFLAEFRAETGSIQEIIFDKQKGGYLLCGNQNYYLSEKVVLAVGRILLGSRALIKEELFPIIQSLIVLCSNDTKISSVKDFLQNGMLCYREPLHGKKLIDQLWILEWAVMEQRYIEVRYEDPQHLGHKVRKLKPMSVMFLDFNFYLMAYILDENQGNEHNSDKEKCGNNTDEVLFAHRVDGILECRVTEEYFSVSFEKSIR